MRKIFLLAALGSLAPCLVLSQERPANQKQLQPVHDMRFCPIQDAHEHMNARGASGMGFSQSTTVHHFLLQPSGGVIQVETKDQKDTAARDSIRQHLTHIAHAFANADFDIPMFVHDTTPPGVPEMKDLKEKIIYSFQETPAGGQVVLQTSDPRALAAIHKFLRFQIEEHQTGDPENVPTEK
jgi:hypothetical protein